MAAMTRNASRPSATADRQGDVAADARDQAKAENRRSSPNEYPEGKAESLAFFRDLRKPDSEFQENLAPQERSGCANMQS
jgi:hypothetical protein